MTGNIKPTRSTPVVRAAGGFTLIEALVAIGAMALVAVGIAAIFQSVGKTISAGRRLNIVNSTAAMVEQQMRRDFASMTRDGFLVIRNSYADANQGSLTAVTRPVDPKKPKPGTDDTVALSSQDTKARLRRVDEILFFAKGDYTTMREPLDSQYVARSKEARIYYGHGLKMTASEPSTPAEPTKSAFLTPDINSGVSIKPNRLGRTGPNQYASSWTLLRQPTLLVNPETAQQALPAGIVFNWNPNFPQQALFLRDKPGQIALQPAALSVFRSLNNFRTYSNTDRFVRTSQEGQRIHAMLNSGLVDIATEDLTAIRTAVLSPNQLNDLPPISVVQYAKYNPFDGTFTVLSLTDSATGPLAAHQWMEDAFPAPSDPTVANDPLYLVPGGQRIRYEASPPDYVDTLAGTATPVALAFKRADQLALTSSNFIPGCTEFIVEYTFGQIDPTTKELVWHGMERTADLGNATIATLTRPYPDRSAVVTGTAPFRLQYRNLRGEVQTAIDDVPRSLIYSSTKALTPNDLSQTAHFGYLDPILMSQGANNEVWDGRPWAWPTLVRVTLSLVDPNNPVNEETFQFILPTPGNPL